MLEPRRPRQLPTGTLGRFIAGLSYPFEGFAFIRAYKLWRVLGINYELCVNLTEF
jgi:hypothetical protein